jgi:hypothetical protein
MDQLSLDLDGLHPEELQRALQAALEELEEVDEMRLAVLGQTGVHIGASQLSHYEGRFKRDQERLETRVAQIRARMATLGITPADTALSQA